MKVSQKTRRIQLSMQRMFDNQPDAPVGQRRELDSRLHGYQRRGVEHLLDHPRAALLMEMGLGKTATVLQSLTPDHFPALVVAPKRVAENVWATEAADWRQDVSIGVAMGTPKQRQRVLDAGHDVVVISINNLAQVKGKRYKTVVLDELSKFKNAQTNAFKNARVVCESAAYVWGLTGTPSPNGYVDLWAQIYLLDRGVRLGRTLGKFRSRWFYPGRQLPSGVVIEWKLRDGAKAEIDELLSDICLSMSAADYLELPEVTVNRVNVRLPPAVRKSYDQMRKELVAAVPEGRVSAANAAVATGKLSQITAGFLYPDADEPDGETVQLHQLKTDAVVEIVENTSTPVLVFYRFQHERDQLARALPQAKLATDDGVIADFQAGRVPVMLAHPASMGHGLNLQKHCHTIVWSSMTWSPEEYDQGNARVNRQGQKHPVLIHRVMAEGTVDESIAQVLAGKATVQQGLMRALAMVE